ncbi:hypothetical protein PHLGIDRAFT_18032 [Phlebiopsis gigantea 11061_1 CR5-6]|uniref:CENP-V/GFA domain-containing protein n=1 Tax=Phlebiopsis gigantea (strain 11061_1 CR5-6) TaxID=745531 RepID=A0A0C3S5I2_PHLG1|nr:hypothetical protein PHLGIDRAFT_18032 [Phlebiopsis gigantea 11061_1 CR5-6]
MSSKVSSDSWTGPPKWPEDAEIKEYAGGCHCKKFRFKFTHPIFENGGMKVTTCNCSICNQHGLYNIYVPQSRFELTSGSEDEMSKYQLAGKPSTHRFCPNCGSNMIVRWGDLVVVNVRAVDDIDVKGLDFFHLDGRNLF